MTRSLRQLLLLSFILLGAGASRAADEKTTTTPFYPLAVGNTWHYRVGINHFSLKVAKMEEVGDKKKLKCARIELIVNDKPISHEHIAVTPEGIVRCTFEGKTAEPPILFFKLP